MARPTTLSAADASADRFRRNLILAVALVGIVALASVLRLYDLGTRAIHPDESIASLLALQAANGGGYEYLPVTHGPLPHLATAAVFAAFGDSDFAARLLPAICGILLAAIPFAMRRQLGNAGAVSASLALAVSPSLLYYTRFAGPDAYLALSTLALVTFVWRYLESANRACLYAASVCLAVMFTSSENALIIAPTFVAFLAYLVGVDLVGQMTHAVEDVATMPQTHYAALGVASDATPNEIRKAYRALVDTADNRAAREALANAFGVLTNPSRRQAYDRRAARRATRPDDSPAIPGPFARAAVFATAPFVVAMWPVIGGWRRRIGLARLPRAADPMLVLLLLALPFYAPLVQMLPFVGDRGFGGQQVTYVIGGVPRTSGGELPVMLVTLGVLFGAAAISGIAWRWHVWVICSAAFYGITTTLFTGFFTNRGGVWTGYWGTMDYWFRPEAQIQREPPYYYGMLVGLYEFLPLAIAAAALAALFVCGTMRDRAVVAIVAAGVSAAIAMPSTMPLIGEHRAAIALGISASGVLLMRLPSFTKFLAFWAVGVFFGFTIATNKSPAFAVHLALPLALLAGKILNDVTAAVRVPSMSRMTFSAAIRPRLAQGAFAAAFAAVSVFSLQTGVPASLGHGRIPQLDHSLVTTDAGDAPLDVLQGDQTAPDVREVRDAIARAADASGEGNAIVVVLDSSYDFAVPWLWYLREYPNIQLRDLRKPYEVPPGAIVLTDVRNRPRLRGVDSAASMTYVQQWSFPRTRYDRMSARDIAAHVSRGDWTEYARDRASIGDLVQREGVVFLPQELRAALPPSRASDVLSTNISKP